MKISELSKKTGASIRSIRHYEKKNLITAVRLENGYREFDESAIKRIRIIQLYLGLGLTTEQIEEILKCEDNGPEEYEFCEEMLETYQAKLDQINRQISVLDVVKYRLEKQIMQMTDKRRMRNGNSLS
ncbi:MULTISPECIES: MerR family transcriptional regulator [Bacillus cereus group]|uniref:MerR family transcriptional regulator n=1 Tax=Bacillus cereus group TaxID=86661 RepID=UPI0022E793E1|nr:MULTISPECIES: MerR family transcriptional regulator [unclassified Bacillus cereus group]MDA1544701.1 MerR family transcriptional regulator [Bacillus cereus group sp. TH253LC]MDA1581012.1 MerR family transcriptional regulator [Bacillus cereus group sp. TH228LC]MDA1627055.1 MerR family transcriptional regulator [Bacillus cereus group sp. TH172LC]MDA1834081.1 MerR family transcriptional regulator [Bacillus cereus group sp. BY142LC]